MIIDGVQVHLARGWPDADILWASRTYNMYCKFVWETKCCVFHCLLVDYLVLFVAVFVLLFVCFLFFVFVILLVFLSGRICL